MYDVLGASTLPVGIVALPNTGNNMALRIAAITAIVVGSIIVLSTVARFVAKHVK